MAGGEWVRVRTGVVPRLKAVALLVSGRVQLSPSCFRRCHYDLNCSANCQQLSAFENPQLRCADRSSVVRPRSFLAVYLSMPPGQMGMSPAPALMVPGGGMMVMPTAAFNDTLDTLVKTPGLYIKEKASGAASTRVADVARARPFAPCEPTARHIQFSGGS